MPDPSSTEPLYAYFSMEVGIDPRIPTYSGGLGVLAGDALRAAADLAIPIVGVTLLYRRGYASQRLDGEGNQTEVPNEWRPDAFLEPLSVRVSVSIEGRSVAIRAWRVSIVGVTGRAVPLYFLDTGLPENSEFDRSLTDNLYGGADPRYRLGQEIVLGIGGARLLEALGHARIERHHLNEGHAALLALALLERAAGARGLGGAVRSDLDAVRRRCLFTTHTPIPAGHDRFPIGLVRDLLGDEAVRAIATVEGRESETLNMSELALAGSRTVNAVSLRHREVTETLFRGTSVQSITNGVHAASWTAEPIARLYDHRIPLWRRDNFHLRQAGSLPLEELRQAHGEAKRVLLEDVARRADVPLDRGVFTIGFARRATGYKRADLLVRDAARLRRIAVEAGPFQVLFSGKAHPRDEGGKQRIRAIFKASKLLGSDVRIVYLEDYDMGLGKLLCAGCDLWLNTPQRPLEASGTSGMKAALNGVPSFSILDGWWVEGHVEGVTGWSIGGEARASDDDEADAASMYEKLESVILPLYYGQPNRYAEVMRSTIAINASYFNAQRMMLQYLENAYRGDGVA